ncbi:MAG: GTP pyrophosphokinase family protein [Candidatus Saccharibacteria bacterium]|nr:GTP pyrophosphokinase family protein [Candidatus Saccharibacteria bacterium]
MEELYKKLTEEEYNKYARLCECGLRIVKTQIENASTIMEEFSDQRNIYDSIEGRIKEYDSVVEKCERKGHELTLESVRKRIRDVAGIRIVTLFQDDIYKIREAIIHQPGLELVDEKDYVKEPKENGYSSLHLIVKVQVQYQGITRSVPVEIQIRTKGMDLWASIEHLACYKHDGKHADQAPELFAEMANHLRQFEKIAERMVNHSEENSVN